MPRAIRIQQPGGPEVMTLGSVPESAPGPEDALVRVEAAGVNFIDTYHRTGLYPVPTPFTPGVEGAGVVEAVGSGVSDLVSRGPGRLGHAVGQLRGSRPCGRRRSWSGCRRE